MPDKVTDPHQVAVRTPHPAALSRDIRQATDEFTAHRRRIVALGLTSAACMGLIALYQIGSIKHLPEPPLTDADRSTPRRRRTHGSRSAMRFSALRATA